MRQYIGARYVPKFYENSDGTAAWKSGVEYEPLTIVTYNGNSYTSKQTVPANVGNPSANPAYWAATGIYNQQIADLTQRMGTAEAQIESINDRIENVEAEQLIIIADSYGEARGTGTNPFIDRMADAFPDKRVFTNALGGRSLAQRSNPAYDTYQHGIALVVNNETALDLSAPTDIYLVGLINDSLAELDIADIRTAMASLFNYVTSTFSGKIRIIYVPCGAYMISTTAQQSRALYYAQEKETIHSSGRVTVNWIDNAAFLLLRADYLNEDMLHPSFSGQNAIYEMMVRLVRREPFNVQHVMRIYDANNLEIGAAYLDNATCMFKFKGNTHSMSLAGLVMSTEAISGTYPLRGSGRHMIGLSNVVMMTDGAGGVNVPNANFYIENGVFNVRAYDAATVAGKNQVVFNQIQVPMSSWCI